MKKINKISLIFFLVTTVCVLLVTAFFAVCLVKLLPTQSDLLALFLYIIFEGALLSKIIVFGLALVTLITFIFLLALTIKKHQMKRKWGALLIYFVAIILLLAINSYFVNPKANTTTFESIVAISAYLVSGLLAVSEIMMARAINFNARSIKQTRSVVDKEALRAKRKLARTKKRDRALLKEAAADQPTSLLEYRYRREMKRAKRKYEKAAKERKKFELRSNIAKAQAKLEEEINAQKQKELAMERKAKELAIARKKALEKKAEAQRKAAIAKREKEKNKALLESKHRAQVKKFAKEKAEKIKVRQAKINKLDEERKLANEARRIEAERQRLLKARAKRAAEIKVWDVYHLMPHPTEGWQLKKMNDKKPIKTFERENDALRYGIKFSKKRDDIKVFLHDKSGKFKRYI